ncbi:MAG: hypothetical protein QME49_09825 [bacterium]|nr:hypothetical protein [bacterium]
MKMVGLEQATLNTCINESQHERLVVTSNGKPVALIVGIEGMDEEQLQLGSSDKFWTLITKRRMQKTISRAKLEQNINEKNSEDGAICLTKG